MFCTILCSSVAIIGGGPSGLAAAKEAIACGLEPTIFEQGNSIGGIWRPEGGKTWESMQINNSRNGCTFSDFEWENSSDDFPNQKDVYQYLCSYAKANVLEEKVHLKSQVTNVEKAQNQWQVEWVNEAGVQTALFDFVIISSGIYSRAFAPEIHGIETFNGLTVHSADYKNPISFKDKRVVVIGNSLSGCEVAAEIAQVAEKVTHVYNRAKWIQSRYLKEQESERTLPYDLSVVRRSEVSRFSRLPLQDRIPMLHLDYRAICHLQSEICPIPEDLQQPFYVGVSDTYLAQVERGAIALRKATVERIVGNTLHLSNGATLEADAIVFCTGYRTEIPFLGKKMQELVDYQSDDPLQPLILYKNTFHPELNNMAFVGMGRFGINFAIVELQARWATLVFSNKLSLPTKDEMRIGLEKEIQIRNQSPRPQFSRNYIIFCDDLANQIGVLPDWNQLQETDPKLYEKLWNGPFTSACYRLIGFDSNYPFALKVIDELYSRSCAPLCKPECVYQEVRAVF